MAGTKDCGCPGAGQAGRSFKSRAAQVRHEIRLMELKARQAKPGIARG